MSGERIQKFARTGLHGTDAILTFLVAALAAAGFLRAAPSLLRHDGQYDFGSYYTAASVLNSGGRVYNAQDMAGAASAAGVREYIDYIYPPLLAALLRPLAMLPFETAALIWRILNILFLFAFAQILSRVARLPPAAPLLVALLAFIFPASYETMLLGQLGVLITFLLAAALAFSRVAAQEKPAFNPWIADAFAGALLGFAAALKIYPLAIALVFLLHRRWTALAAAGATLLLAFLAGLLLGGGPENSLPFFTQVLPALSSPNPWPANQSLQGVMRRLFEVTHLSVTVLNKDNHLPVTLYPLVNSPALGAGLAWLGSAAIAGVTLLKLALPRLRSQRNSEDHAGIVPAKFASNRFAYDFSLVLTAVLLTGPTVWDHYYVHLWIPFAFLWISYQRKPFRPTLIWLALLLLVLQRFWRWTLILAPYPWLSLCGFAGVFLLWLVLIRLPELGPDSLDH